MDGALKWDGKDVRHMAGIAWVAEAVRLFRQPAYSKAIPTTAFEIMAAYDSQIHDLWTLGR